MTLAVAEGVALTVAIALVIEAAIFRGTFALFEIAARLIERLPK